MQCKKKRSESGGNGSENLREIWHTAPQPGQNFVCGGSGAPHSEQNRGLWVDCRGRRQLGMEERGGRHDSDTHPIPDTQTHLHTHIPPTKKQPTPRHPHARTQTHAQAHPNTNRQTDRQTDSPSAERVDILFHVVDVPVSLQTDRQEERGKERKEDAMQVPITLQN